MKNKRKSTTDRLSNYLTAAVGIGTVVGTADAAIVNLDITQFDGLNAGLSLGSTLKHVTLASLGAGLTGEFNIYRVPVAMGISASGAQIAYSGGFASPVDFDAGFLIDGTSSFSAFKPFLFFSFYHYSSNTFGANSFIGFRSGNNHYGWLEVTWDSVSKDFEFIKGAFNDVAGEGIEAGRGASAIPEPASVLSTMGMLASGLLIRRRKLAA
jgi:hypothetical protein